MNKSVTIGVVFIDNFIFCIGGVHSISLCRLFNINYILRRCLSQQLTSLLKLLLDVGYLGSVFFQICCWVHQKIDFLCYFEQFSAIIILFINLFLVLINFTLLWMCFRCMSSNRLKLLEPLVTKLTFER